MSPWSWPRGLVHSLQINEQGSTIQETPFKHRTLQPYFKPRKGTSQTSLRCGVLTKFDVDFFPTSRSTQEIEKITTNKLLTRTFFQQFLNQVPRSSFKKFQCHRYSKDCIWWASWSLFQRDSNHDNVSKPSYMSHCLSPTYLRRMRYKKMSPSWQTSKSRPPLRKMPPSTFRRGTRMGCKKPFWCTWQWC